MVIIAPYPGEDAQFQSAAIERTASMYDGHPTALAREPYSSASIRIDELHSVTDDTRNPSNPPYPIGLQVSLLRGDGKAWWRHWGMMIDQRDGTLLDGSANLEDRKSVVKGTGLEFRRVLFRSRRWHGSRTPRPPSASTSCTRSPTTPATPRTRRTRSGCRSACCAETARRGGVTGA